MQGELPNGYTRVALGDVDSTNTSALELVKAGEPGNLWVTANRQLKGRGSRGRFWVSEPGNLYASLLLVNPASETLLPSLTFVASLAIRDAIMALAGQSMNQVQLKWPNDVLLNGKKTSGILLESHKLRDRHVVMIGMGINIAHHPQNTLYPSTCLNDENISADIETLFSCLAVSMAERLQQWNKGLGFADIRADWMHHAAGIGQSIRVEVPGKENNVHSVSGVFKGIDEAGYMLIDTGGQNPEKVSVADIFFA